MNRYFIQWTAISAVCLAWLFGGNMAEQGAQNLAMLAYLSGTSQEKTLSDAPLLPCCRRSAPVTAAEPVQHCRKHKPTFLRLNNASGSIIAFLFPTGGYNPTVTIPRRTK